MPVFRSGKGKAPAWCEMEDFEVLRVEAGQTIALERGGKKEQIIVCSGAVEAASGGVKAFLREGGKMDLSGSNAAPYVISGVAEESAVFRAVGRWGSIASSGIFYAASAEPPMHDTPHAYAKTTGFDNHYHDCDEYWIVLDGRAVVASEGRLYKVGPGDCLATGMGWHHDVVSVEGDKPIKAVWLEGTLEGMGREGHLWEPRHGRAEPRVERV